MANTGELIRHGSELFQVDKEAARDFFRTMEIQSSAAAVENLLLAATSLGLGSVWLGILFLMKDEVLHFLGEPEGEFMAVMPVGYPAKTTEGPKKRPLETIGPVSGLRTLTLLRPHNTVVVRIDPAGLAPVVKQTGRLTPPLPLLRPYPACPGSEADCSAIA